MQLHVVPARIPEGSNLILGQAHFIKTVEDLSEALVNSVPGIRFGVGFCEASGDRLVRWDGNDDELTRAAVELAQAVGAGHLFVVFLREAFPINVLPKIRDCHEVVRLFCATANPVQVLVAETDQGRGVVGVVDGHPPVGVEDAAGQEVRRQFLRRIGYKR